MCMLRNFFILLIVPLLAGFAQSGTWIYSYGIYSYDSDNILQGEIQKYRLEKRESLIEAARKFDLGYNEIVEANPGIDPFIPEDGTEITVPTFWIVPDTDGPEGIIVNLSELRLYFYYRGNGITLIETFPIGIGSEGHNTPVGEFKVVEKIIAPSWHVPKSIRKENPELPKIVPPGPENPLGSHAMRLSNRTILMHGTNRPFAVGRLASHGCLRLYPEDIPRLFDLTPEGLNIAIVRRPVKTGSKEGRVYIEVHEDDQAGINYFDEAVSLLRKKGLLKITSIKKMYAAIERKTGVPTDITEEREGSRAYGDHPFY